jgi:hypothetical protein
MRSDQDETLFLLCLCGSIGVWGYHIHTHQQHSSLLALRMDTKGTAVCDLGLGFICLVDKQIHTFCYAPRPVMST